MVVGLAEALVRNGFDLRRQELSLLANGDLGWIHVLMMVVTGLLAVATPSIARQCLNLEPVLLGDGIRFFDGLRDTPVMLDDPEVTEGTRVTHLQFRVRPRTGG